ncbi:gliding motility-associated C-terminal domain-containing protein [uncultured Psychroserpens sp.]|uniref:DUF7933 domain-containing protein n=1 Tax=uncultured Psychroserpens sp. TaxID=255436 RepID=UPI00261B551C|nr:gliding motility-associated C-terminal domain-containing protein [uncultured Psychroserpens sp.]
MIKIVFRFIFFLIICNFTHSQTTDLSIVAQAQNTSGSDISQIEIFQDFQYIITIINSGNPVTNATFEVVMDTDLQNLDTSNITSQNNTGGASNASGLDLINNTLTGTIANLPTDSSLEIKINVTAPSIIGGIAINANIFPPNGTTDTNSSNNESLISIDVIDIDIDFTVTLTQVSPTEGTPIPSWNTTVTYQFTITNNSAIDFPIESFSGNLSLLTDIDFGRPFVQLQSINCIGSTGGTNCPDVSGVNGNITFVSATSTIFTFNTSHLYTAGGSATFEVVYEYLDPSCALEIQPIAVSSEIGITLNHANLSPNTSNSVITDLLESEPCQLTDICIDTVQIDPAAGTAVDWNEEVVFETTVCNNGPLDTSIAFFLQNISATVDWDIIAVECIQATGSISCDDVTINIQDQFWVSSTFIMPANATITIQTIVIFIEPACSANINNNLASVRSGVNILNPNILDSNITNNAQTDFVTLPPSEQCDIIDLSVTKTQIDPVPPNGETANNPLQPGNVTYEITVTNPSNVDTPVELIDFPETISMVPYFGTLISVECVSTTGSATCFDITNANIGIPLDGIQENGNPDVFWEITADDNWLLPAMSSVTFHVVIAWETECSINAIPVANVVEIGHTNNAFDNNPGNNIADVTTYFVPCVDLIVQTFPEFTQVNVNQPFDWIIDITNSENSTNAINILFEDTINTVFTLTGTPICTITNGNATCINNPTINGNLVTATIDNMDAGSTIRIRIPVVAPSFGGAYNNIAVATPNETDRREISPETNTSISNVQVLAPSLIKSYNPDTIIVGEESTLTFTVSNLASNPSQTNISFTDVFHPEITLVSSPQWVTSNGCTANFVGNAGNNFAGVTNLVFPEGVSFCSFSVVVTSDVVGVYLNDTTNFENQNNIDTSQTNATLTVLEDTSDVDIEILKNVSPQEAIIGDQVIFEITATNVGTTEGTEIEIYDNFPSGMTFISATTSQGTFDVSMYIWSIGSLASGQSETLTITAQINASDNLLNVASLNDLDQPDRDLSNNSDSAEVIVNFCLRIPKGFSPNGDGLNDVFDIQCIEEYPNNLIKVYNRLGVQVYESENYKGGWNGKPNMGIPTLTNTLPTGTYFYILDLNNGEKPIVGWFYVNY